MRRFNAGVITLIIIAAYLSRQLLFQIFIWPLIIS